MKSASPPQGGRGIIKTRSVYFPSSVNLKYSQALFSVRYKQSYDGTKLILDPSLRYGGMNEALDLRNWDKCHEIVHMHIDRYRAIKTLTLTDDPSCNDDFIEYMLTTYFKMSILELHVDSCTYISFRGLGQLLELKNLTTLSLVNMQDIDNEFIQLITRTLFYLSDLNIAGCTKVTDTAMIAIADLFCLQVKSLNLANLPLITQVGLNEIIMKCQELRKLDISGCISVTFLGIVVKARDNMLQYIARKLTHLNITYCKHMQYYALIWISTALPELLEFSAENVFAVDDHFLKSLVGGCRSLQKLNINNCYQITHHAMSIVYSFCPKLVDFRLSNIHHDKVDNKVLGSILAKCRDTLVNLQMSVNIGIRNEVFDALIAQLESQAIAKAEGSAISSRKKPAMKLQSLDISYTSITTLGVVHACQVFSSTLLELNISGLRDVNDAALLSLPHSCPNLRRLYANGCWSITDNGIRTVCQHCHELQVLHIAYEVIDSHHQAGFQLTDASVEYILTKAKKLKEVDLSHQLSITLTSKHILSWFTSPSTAAAPTSKNSSFISRKVAKSRFCTGNFSLQKLVLIGCKKLEEQHFEYLFSHCYALNSVILPESMLEVSALKTRKFWMNSFKKTVYTLPYDQSWIIAQEKEIHQTLQLHVDTKKQSLSSIKNKDNDGNFDAFITKYNATFKHNQLQFLFRSPGFQVLQPLPPQEKEKLEFRDQLTRRFNLEKFAARVIYVAYLSFRIWKKLKQSIMKRKIVKNYRLYRKEQTRLLKIRQFVVLHASKAIYNFYYHHFLKFKRAIQKILKVYVNWRNKRQFAQFQRQAKYAILIQKRVRGMLFRLSYEHIIAQIYLNLPSFIKEIAHISPPIDGPQIHAAVLKKLPKVNVQKHELTSLKKHTQETLHHITYSIAKGEKLAPKLPKIINQTFDVEAYVSLSDGRKLSFYSTESSLFNSEFIKKSYNSAKDRLSNATLSFMEGKTAEFCGNKNGGNKVTAEELSSTNMPVHIYSSKFWPPTQQPSTNNSHGGGGSHVQKSAFFDPHLNNFEFAEKSFRQTLTCEICQHRLRLLHCVTCARGFCFFCALQFHRGLTKQNHELKVIEPRIVSLDHYTADSNHNSKAGGQTGEIISKSLLFHIDNAHSVMHEVKYLVKYLRSASETQRLAKERKLLKDYEKQQEMQRIAFLQAQSLYREKNISATKLSLLYRMKKARLLVTQKREQLKLEKVMSQVKLFQVGLLKLQVLYRRFETRLWLFRHGFLFRGVPKYYALVADNKSSKQQQKRQQQRVLVKSKRTNKKGKILPSKVRSDRTELETTRRSVYGRQVLFGLLEEKYCASIQILKASFSYWLQRYHAIEPIILKCQTLRQQFFDEHHNKQLEVSMSNLRGTDQERTRNEITIKILRLRYENMEERLENARNMSWWITQHLRYTYRKLSLLPIRLENIHKQIQWISEENAIFSRGKLHCEARIQKLEHDYSNDTMNAPKLWLTEKLEFIIQQQVALDAQQESVLRDEIARVERDYFEIVTFDNLLEELMQSLHANSQLFAERIALDKKLTDLVYGSEEGVAINEQLILLKSKQKQLSLTTIDNLKVALQQRHDEHDLSNLTQYAFLHDKPDLQITEMHLITAVLLDVFTPPSHFQVEEFLKIYFLQPWLAIQSVEDIRFEERISLKEIRLGQVREEMLDLENTLLDSQKCVVDLQVKINDLQVKVEAHYNPVPDESDIQKEKREIILADFQRELEETKSELALKQKFITDAELLRPLKQLDVERILADIEEIEAKLVKRQMLRDTSIKLFFDFEKSICESLGHDLQPMIVHAEDEMSSLLVKIESCKGPLEAYADDDDQQSEGQKNKKLLEAEATAVAEQPQLAAADSNSSNKSSKKLKEEIIFPSDIAPFPHQMTLQQHLHSTRPRSNCSPTQLAYTLIQVKFFTFQTNHNYNQFLYDRLMKEQVFLLNYKNQRNLYENFLENYIEELQFVRRQRAFDNDLHLRRSRLLEMRDIRLKQLETLKREQQAVEEAANKKKEEAERNRKNRFSRAAQNAKKTIRNLKDAARDFQRRRAMDMDDEELRMAKNIREKNKEGANARSEAIKAIYLTNGQAETLAFTRENDHLSDKGLPCYTRMERSIGNQIYLWTQLTFDDTQFITDISLAQKDPNHPEFFSLTDQKFQFIESPTCHLRIWYKKDIFKAQAIKEFRVSYTEQEEIRNTVDGYERVDPPLNAFDLPDVVLWIQRIQRAKPPSITNTAALIAEINKVRDMIRMQPNNQNIKGLLTRLNEKLAECMKKEEEAEVTDPLQAAVQLMALTEEEVQQWILIFEKIDAEKKGKVSIIQIFEWLKQPPTLVAKEVFISIDAPDEHGYIEFGDFVRAFGTFCFFGKDELLRFMYVYVDKDRTGYMTAEQFEQVVELINPTEKLRARRALKVMKLDARKKLTIADWQRIHDQYPAIFAPIFLLQNAMRTMTMGDTWWFLKLSKYKEVRKKLAMDGQHTQDMVELELSRFKEDEERRERMAKREAAIEQEGSQIRKTLLQARQFLDEIS